MARVASAAPRLVPVLTTLGFLFTPSLAAWFVFNLVGGMASGLAMNTLQSAKAALAPAIFGPWMNVSGSILASYWRKRPAPGPSGETPNP